MSLRDLIRQSVPADVATATVATIATLNPSTGLSVASVASVAVATAPRRTFQNLPSEWQAGLASLSIDVVPAGILEPRWVELLGDTLRLGDEWGAAAHALGWDELALFGHDPNPLARRVDTAGLAALLKGRPVIALDYATATILGPRSDRMRFQRFPGQGANSPAPGSIPIWRLARPDVLVGEFI